MEKENTGNEIEIDIVGLFFAILNKLAIILLIAVLTGGMAYGYSKFFITPKYTATTKVYILNKQENSTENETERRLTTQDLAFATALTNDYQVLLKSEPVLQEVKEELNLNMGTGALASLISVSLEENTRIIDISATTTNPQLSKQIADKVRDVANVKIKEVMKGIEAVNPIDEAKLPAVPSSPNIRKNTLLGFALGFAISVLVVAIIFILDDTVKTPEDIEKKLEVSVLASIPLKEEENSSGKKKKKKKNRRKKGEDEEYGSDNAESK